MAAFDVNETRQLTRELRTIVREADPTFDKNHRFLKEYEFSGPRAFFADYQQRGPYDPIQNVEEGLQENADTWPSYTTYDYFGGPNA